MTTVFEQLTKFQRDYQTLRQEVGKIIVGQGSVVEAVFVCLLAQGHALLEGVPGLGKTQLVRTLAKVLDLAFSRIQFTPDLMPADITGTNMIADDSAGHKYFEFQRGPIFANIVLADEINRATPKTQSALLEAMQERTVTVARTTFNLESPFMVLATQNPLEMEGTYPLPEAQLDRFMFKLQVPFPTHAELDEIMKRTTAFEEPVVQQVLDRDTILAMRSLAYQVEVADHVRDYSIRLLQATHPNSPHAPAITTKYVRYGASPRGAQSIILASKIKAAMDGRASISKQDIRYNLKNAFRHRIIMNFEGQAEGISEDKILDDILSHVPEVTK